MRGVIFKIPFQTTIFKILKNEKSVERTLSFFGMHMYQKYEKYHFKNRVEDNGEGGIIYPRTPKCG